MPVEMGKVLWGMNQVDKIWLIVDGSSVFEARLAHVFHRTEGAQPWSVALEREQSEAVDRSSCGLVL